MPEGPAGLALYGALKYAVYTAWCAAGLALLAGRAAVAPRRALGLGALRVALGLAFGTFIFLASLAVFAGISETPLAGSRVLAHAATYLAVYVPVRWLEWGILELVVDPERRGLGGLLLGGSGRGRAFRLGGILVSCLADLPMILSIGGLPVGRFLC